MEDFHKGILMYESTLNADARMRVHEIGRAEIVIGIPSYRNGRTIGEVIDTIIRGITDYMPDRRIVLMNADGGSSDNTVRHLEDADVPANVEKLIVTYDGATGKGTAVRCVFEAAAYLESAACAVFEARAPGIQPHWVPGLIEPVLRGDDLVVGCYRRSAYSSALNDNIVYPFLRTFFNTDLRDPIAGEFAISGQLAAVFASEDVWETDVARFGVNIWVAMQALAEQRRISQVMLGNRGECSGDPGALLDARFLHTVGTLFRLLTVHKRYWRNRPGARHLALHAAPCDVEEIECPNVRDELVSCLEEGTERYANYWDDALLPETRAELQPYLKGAPSRVELPVDLWAKIVLEFAIVYNRGEGDPDKIIEALLPLFYVRAAAYIEESMGMTPEQREVLVDGIVRAFRDAVPAFLVGWNAGDRWLDDTSRFWLT